MSSFTLRLLSATSALAAVACLSSIAHAQGNSAKAEVALSKRRVNERIETVLLSSIDWRRLGEDTQPKRHRKVRGNFRFKHRKRRRNWMAESTKQISV